MYLHINASDQKIRKVTEAGLLEKFGYWITGKTKDIYQEAVQNQGKIQKEILRLVFLNTYLSGELYKHQQLLEEQGRQILENAQRQEQQNQQQTEAMTKIRKNQEKIQELLEAQGKLLNGLPALKDDLANLGRKLHEHDKQLETTESNVKSLEETVYENTSAINTHRQEWMAFKKKIIITVVFAVALSLGVFSLFLTLK